MSFYHVLSNMRENRMNIEDFYDLYYFNGFNILSRLGPIFAPNRHQRHQGLVEFCFSGNSNSGKEDLDFSG